MKLKLTQPTIGADPEFFLLKNGSPYSVEGLLGGTKEMPFQIEEGYGFLEDNVMAEFNIPPATSAKEFQDSNVRMIETIMEVLNGIDVELEPCFLPSLRFDEKFLQTAQAKEFGCEPDFNAYTFKAQRPSAAQAGNLRTAGGHIHIGWKEDNKEIETQAAVCRAFDAMVVIPFMLIEPENERRQLYGQPGSFRPKKYGVECRQLSCYWLSSRKLMKWVFDRTKAALKFFNENDDIRDPKSALCKEVQKIIKNKQMRKAKEFSERFAIELV